MSICILSQYNASCIYHFIITEVLSIVAVDLEDYRWSWFRVQCSVQFDS